MLKGKSHAIKKVTNENGRVRVQTVNPLPSKTQQQFKTKCDINHIMKQAMASGELPHQRSARGYYMDHTVLPQDYQAALNLVLEGNQAFNNLASETRKRFDNDPKKLLTFLSDPKNHEEAIKLGIKEHVEEVPVEKAKPAQRQKAKNDEPKNNDE